MVTQKKQVTEGSTEPASLSPTGPGKNFIEQPKAEEKSNETPPVPKDDRFSFVNQKRLQMLAGSKYKGPSYKETYNKADMLIVAKHDLQKTQQNDRMPASEKKEKKATK